MFYTVKQSETKLNAWNINFSVINFSIFELFLKFLD